MIEENEITRIKRGLNWINLKESLDAEGCPVCNSMSRSIKKYFDFLLYEYALDASVHKKTLASFGMCNTHTYMLKEAEANLKSDGLNIAVLYETLFQKEEKLLAKIEERKFNNKKSILNISKKNDFLSYKKQLLTEIKPKPSNSVSRGICPGCQHQKENESFCTHEILRIYKDDEFQKKYENEKVLLCRHHFIFLINESEKMETIEYFIKIHKTKIATLHKQLSGFIEKHDYRLKSRMTEEEKISWEKALEYFGSKKNIDREGYNDLLVE